MALHKTISGSTKDALKNAGTWFVAGNAFLNGQTHALIPLAYAALFTTQRVISHIWGNQVSSRLGKFLLGKQGPLFFSAVETGLVGGFTKAVHGSAKLAAACFEFSAANGTQAAVYDGIAKFSPTKYGKLLKSFTLAACEATILCGLDEVAQNAGYSSHTAAELAAPGFLFAAARAFTPKALPPDLAYVDMMGLAVATGAEAFIKGHYLNGISRIFAIAGFSRLAVARAHMEGKHSIFEVEHWAAKAVEKIRPQPVLQQL